MDSHVDDLVRTRLRALRQHRRLSLDELAARTGVGPSTISRIETGNRSISLDVLVPLARELGVGVDELLASADDDDIVIRPEPTDWEGMTVWPLSKPGSPMVSMKVRLEPVPDPPEAQVHPGHDWVFVLDGSVELTLGERTIRIEPGESAEFPTMTPHAFRAIGGPAEVLMVFDRDGAHAHLNES